MNTFETKGGTKLPLLSLKGKDYLQVQHRVQWFREEHPDWTIETEIKELGEGFCGKAIIRNPEGRVIAMAHKTETFSGFSDPLEKAETGAIGRALALCGFGTQFAQEIEEGERIVDSPLPAKTAKPVSSGAHYCCNNRMMTSKYDLSPEGLPTMYYCPKCKKKVPIDRQPTLKSKTSPEAVPAHLKGIPMDDFEIVESKESLL